MATFGEDGMVRWMRRMFRIFSGYRKKQVNEMPRVTRSLEISIDFITPSDTAKCLHEAGHAYACLHVGIVPKFMELIDDPSSLGTARVSASVPQPELRRLVACGALAVELNLHKAGRIVDTSGVPLTDKQFIDVALGNNAAMDKIMYFGRDFEQANKRWPKQMDEAFLSLAKALAEEISMPCVFDLATALLNERFVSGDRLMEIAGPYLPENVEDWQAGSGPTSC